MKKIALPAVGVLAEILFAIAAIAIGLLLAVLL